MEYLLKLRDIFKKSTDVPTGQLLNQLWQCCDKDLEEDLLKYVEDISTIDRQELLQAIRRLAIISTVVSARKCSSYRSAKITDSPYENLLQESRAKHRFVPPQKNVPTLIVDEWLLTQMKLLNIT